MRPTTSDLARLLDYDPSTGVMVWKSRPWLVGKAAGWNARYAGQQAGTIDKDGYIVITIAKIKYPAHVLAWVMVTSGWPLDLIDHENGLKGDNRFINLREADTAQNGWNTGLTKRNRSGAKGVSWHAVAKKWQVSVRAGGKDYTFGVHDDFDLAAVIAHEARANFHGEFARSE